MAYKANGGTITVPAVATNLVDLLIAAGIADPPVKSPADKGVRAHVSYHILNLKSDESAGATIYLGHTSTMTNANADRAIQLVAKASYTENLVNGMGALEQWWVVGNGSDKLFVHWVE